ncbi:tRNA (32-2'-O)-methyltransferase regulator THADA-like [Anomaloglossus baeobatrachus]
MVVKKKKEISVDVLLLDTQSIQNLKAFTDDTEQNLPSLLLQCLHLHDGVQQIHCIKKIAPLLENLPSSSIGSDELRCCMSVLAEMYFTVGTKNPLKKVLGSLLNSVPDPCKKDTASALTSCLRREVTEEDVGSYRKVVDNLASCMDSFSLGGGCVISLMPEALRFLVKVLHTFQSQNKRLLGDGLAQTQLMHDLLTAVKLSMVLLQKCPDSVPDALLLQGPLWKTMCDLLRCFCGFLLDDDLLQNIQSTAGMAAILYLKIMIVDGDKLMDLVNNVILQSVAGSAVPDWFLACCDALCTDLPDTALLFLCQGALAMLDWKAGSLGCGGERLLLNLLSVLLSLSARPECHSSPRPSDDSGEESDAASLLDSDQAADVRRMVDSLVDAVNTTLKLQPDSATTQSSQGTPLRDATDRNIERFARSAFEAAGAALSPAFVAVWVAKAMVTWADTLRRGLCSQSGDPELVNMAAQIALADSERFRGVYSNLFVVPKKDGTVRPVLDLKILNRDNEMHLTPLIRYFFLRLETIIHSNKKRY